MRLGIFWRLKCFKTLIFFGIFKVSYEIEVPRILWIFIEFQLNQFFPEEIGVFTCMKWKIKSFSLLYFKLTWCEMKCFIGEKKILWKLFFFNKCVPRKIELFLGKVNMKYDRQISLCNLIFVLRFSISKVTPFLYYG